MKIIRLKAFSKKEENNNKKKHLMKDVKGWKKHSGLGYALLGGPGGAIGMMSGQAVADEAEEKGKSDDKILKRATAFGGASGAATNMLLHTMRNGGNVDPKYLALDTAAGGVFGALAARRNTKVRRELRDALNKENKNKKKKDDSSKKK